MHFCKSEIFFISGLDTTSVIPKVICPSGYRIAGVKMMTISPGTVTGHAAAGGAIAADVEFLNRETGAFLDAVTEGGKRLN